MKKLWSKQQEKQAFLFSRYDTVLLTINHLLVCEDKPQNTYFIQSNVFDNATTH